MRPLRPSPERAGSAPARETTVPGLLGAACQEMIEAVGASAVTISRVIGDLLVDLADCSDSGQPVQVGHGYLISDFPLTKEVIETGEPRCVSLLDEDPDPAEAALLTQIGFESLLMVPLPAGGRCWGLVEMYGNGRPFLPADVLAAEEVVAQTGQRLEQLDDAA